MKGIVDINVEGIDTAGDDAEVGVTKPIAMRSTGSNNVGALCIVGDLIVATTAGGGGADVIASGGPVTSRPCYVDGINFLGTKHA